MNNSKLLFILLLGLCIAGCNTSEDVKNTYTISGRVSREILVTFLPNLDIRFDTIKFAVNLISNDQIIATSVDTSFTFPGLEEGKSYTIIPEQVGTEGNGLTALDYVFVKNYIEGEQVLDAFQKLAADVNRDNKIDSTDMALILNCTLDSKQCFNYRFATRDYDGNGKGQVDQYIINHLMSDVTINLLHIRTGDVTGTHNPN